MTIAPLLGLLAGCEMMGPRDGQGGATAQRMRAAYADLKSGRMLILADFEAPGDAKLLRLEAGGADVDEQDQPRISIFRSRNDTGAGGLKVTMPPSTRPAASSRPAADPAQAGSGPILWLDAQRSESLGLVRDWRSYTILLWSVYGPEEGTRLAFTLHSGDPPALTWSTTVRALRGWTLVRIDLAEAGEQIDLGDVRAMSWRVLDGGDEPVDLYFDDFVLADNTEVILAPSDAPDAMYAIRAGRRLYIGAPGRYELAFADGQIAAWHEPGVAADLPAPVADASAPSPDSTPPSSPSETSPIAQDSASGGLPASPAAMRPELPRLAATNLTAPSGLGPWPAPLSAGWDDPRQPMGAAGDPAQFAAWGDHVAIEQALLETTPFRVIVRGEWRFRRDAGAESDPAVTTPRHAWTYTLYPSGQVYLQLESGAAGAGWPAPLLGLAAVVDARRGFEPLHGRGEGERYALLARRGEGQADLLWVPARAELATMQRAVESEGGRRLALILGAVEPEDRHESAHLLRFWPLDINGPAEAASIAADYAEPARVGATSGRVLTDVPGDLDADGFNESQGCYELAADAGVLRFAFDPAGRLRYQPVFRVHGTQGLRTWVYVDGRIIQSTGRDAQGRLVIRLPEVVSRPLSVEVYSRQ